jgi:CheY-like chemotaxis protein
MEPYNAMLMDLQMPVMAGFDATMAIRRIQGRGSLPVIAMTAHAFDEDRLRVLAAGMNDYISTPIDSATQAATLARWVGRPATAPANPPDIPPFLDSPSPATVESISLPGFNVPAALERLFQNEELFLELVRNFARTYRNAVEKISGAIAAGNFGEAELVVHTLRGSAGNLSADELFLVAGNLEKAISRQQQEQIPALIEQLAEVISVPLASASALPPAPPETAF